MEGFSHLYLRIVMQQGFSASCLTDTQDTGCGEFVFYLNSSFFLRRLCVKTMAKFLAPVIQDNPSGWGPCAVPEKFKDMPYQPFSKGDRLGKVTSLSLRLSFSHTLSLCIALCLTPSLSLCQTLTHTHTHNHPKWSSVDGIESSDSTVSSLNGIDYFFLRQ